MDHMPAAGREVRPNSLSMDIRNSAVDRKVLWFLLTLAFISNLLSIQFAQLIFHLSLTECLGGWTASVPATICGYNLRPRGHRLILPEIQPGYLRENLINRMVYFDIYWSMCCDGSIFLYFCRARSYIIAVLAVVILSVCPSVRLFVHHTRAM